MLTSRMTLGRHPGRATLFDASVRPLWPCLFPPKRQLRFLYVNFETAPFFSHCCKRLLPQPQLIDAVANCQGGTPPSHGYCYPHLPISRRMNRSANCVCNPSRINSSKFIGLKLPVESIDPKNMGVGGAPVVTLVTPPVLRSVVEFTLSLSEALVLSLVQGRAKPAVALAKAGQPRQASCNLNHFMEPPKRRRGTLHRELGAIDRGSRQRESKSRTLLEMTSRKYLRCATDDPFK